MDTTRANRARAAAGARPISRRALIASWVLQVVAAAVLAQTLFFKFTGAPEAVHIFSTLGVEPWGRIGTGVIELITAALLVIPRTAVFGAALALGLMAGAIASHLGPLGIEVQDDGGLLFGLALLVSGCGAGVLALRRHEVIRLSRSLRRRLFS